MKTFYLSTVLVWFFFTGLSGQAFLERSVIASAGEESAAVDGLHFSWTLGEVAVETLLSDDLMLTQGFQQSEPLISPVIELEGAGLSISVFPNPVSEMLTISQKGEPQSFRLDLFDLNGRLIAQYDIQEPVRQLNLYRLPAAIYLLRFSGENGMRDTMRISKIN